MKKKRARSKGRRGPDHTPAADRSSRALRRLEKLAAYSVPVITAFEGTVLTQAATLRGRDPGPALTTLGALAMGAGLAGAGAYKLLKSKRKKPRGRGPGGTAPKN
jgi:hypothetical protein